MFAGLAAQGLCAVRAPPAALSEEPRPARRDEGLDRAPARHRLGVVAKVIVQDDRRLANRRPSFLAWYTRCASGVYFNFRLPPTPLRALLNRTFGSPSESLAVR